MNVSYGDVSGEYVEADGVRLHYGEAGEGAPVLMLHGTGPGSSAWRNFRSNVGALAEHHRTILLDFPRYGGSEKLVIEEPRLTYLSRIVRAFMDELGLDHAHIVGNSMGGQVGLKVAADAPDRVGRMVLIGPAVIGHSIFTPMPAETVRLIAGYYKGEGPTFEKMRLMMESLVYNKDLITDEAVRERYEASVDPEVLEVMAGPHWAHQSIEDELPDVHSETLLVWGIDDRASPLDHSLVLMRLLPHARLHILAQCGHSAQLERADEFNQLALDFLGRGIPD